MNIIAEIIRLKNLKRTLKTQRELRRLEPTTLLERIQIQLKAGHPAKRHLKVVFFAGRRKMAQH